MGANDVYFRVAGDRQILAQSTQEGGDDYGTESKSNTIELPQRFVGDDININFDTLDGIANNGLQGTFEFTSNNGQIKFQNVETGEISSTHLLPDEPTVPGEPDEDGNDKGGERYNETKTIRLIANSAEVKKD